MNFRDIACSHLANYKVNRLGVKENGEFHYRGEILKKAHILPHKHLKLNILEEFRDRFFDSEYARIKLHKYFHHLNSSQALCINLFYPLITENKLELATTFLGLTPATNFEACFEKESDVESADRRTSFDFHTHYSKTQELFVEVKYTEEGFGKAKFDDAHRAKFKNTYLPLVKQSHFLTDTCRDEDFFLSHYQVLRNLVHISETRQVALLFPAANTVVNKEAEEACNEMLTDAGKSKCKRVFLEELVAFLGTDGLLKDYYYEFREKYLPPLIPDATNHIG